MKKVLYWTLYIPIGVLTIIVGLLQALFEAAASGLEWVDDRFHMFEAWCLDYKKRMPHMHYIGGGFWSSYKREEGD